MSEFENIIEQLGSFGPYQVRIFVLVSLFEIPCAWAMLLPVFIGATPNWLCQGVVKNISYRGYSQNQTVRDVNNTENSCSNQNEACQGLKFTSEFTSIVTEWGLVCDKVYVSDLITTLQMLGVLIGACIIGQLADTLGRRKVFYAAYTLLLCAELATAFVTSWELYAVFRFFVGALIGGTMLINFVLPMEFIGPRWRTFCGCIGFWAVGVMSLALLAYLLRDWRSLTMTCSAFGVPLLFTWWFVPESPRWLLQKNRQEEARKILMKIAVFNKKDMPDFQSLTQFTAQEKEKRDRIRQFSYWDLFRTPAMCKNTLIIMFAWLVSSSVYYGTSFNIKNLEGNRYMTLFISGLVELPGVILVVLLNNRLGRRKTLFMFMICAGLFSISVLFVDATGKSEEFWWLKMMLAMIGRFGIAGGWGAAQVFSAELFPTVVRNIGIGACSMSARVGGIVAPQIVFLNAVSKPVPYIIFGSLGISCALLTWLLPETNNRALQDVLPDWSWSRSRDLDENRQENGVSKMLVNGNSNQVPVISSETSL